MKVRFSNWKLLAVSETGMTTSPLEQVGPVRVAEVSNADELFREFGAYREEIAALKKPAVIMFARAPGDRSRAFPGFKKLEAQSETRRGLVNQNLLAE